MIINDDSSFGVLENQKLNDAGDAIDMSISRYEVHEVHERCPLKSVEEFHENAKDYNGIGLLFLESHWLNLALSQAQIPDPSLYSRSLFPVPNPSPGSDQTD